MSYDRPASRLQVPPQPVSPKPWLPGETTRRTDRVLPLARRYELFWIDVDGRPHTRVEIGPAMPLFEEAFSAFTHGVLIHTTAGEVPIEDLEPGMMLLCPNARETRLMWKGAITIVPGAPTANDTPPMLYRVTVDAFGPGRPSRDLLLGPAARRLVRDPGLRAHTGTEAALARLDGNVDGDSVIEVHPVQPIRVFHLMADGHATILANGLEVETYHPGADTGRSLSHEMQRTFRMLFPHLQPAGAFGRELWPRVGTVDEAKELL